MLEDGRVSEKRCSTTRVIGPLDDRSDDGSNRALAVHADFEVARGRGPTSGPEGDQSRTLPQVRALLVRVRRVDAVPSPALVARIVIGPAARPLTS
jgi:hypothetical protein